MPLVRLPGHTDFALSLHVLRKGRTGQGQPFTDCGSSSWQYLKVLLREGDVCATATCSPSTARGSAETLCCLASHNTGGGADARDRDAGAPFCGQISTKPSRRKTTIGMHFSTSLGSSTSSPGLQYLTNFCVANDFHFATCPHNLPSKFPPPPAHSLLRNCRIQ